MKKYIVTERVTTDYVHEFTEDDLTKFLGEGWQGMSVEEACTEMVNITGAPVDSYKDWDNKEVLVEEQE